MEKIENTSWFFEKISKIVRPVARLIKKIRAKSHITNIVNNREIFTKDHTNNQE